MSFLVYNCFTTSLIQFTRFWHLSCNIELQDCCLQFVNVCWFATGYIPFHVASKIFNWFEFWRLCRSVRDLDSVVKKPLSSKFASMLWVIGLLIYPYEWNIFERVRQHNFLQYFDINKWIHNFFNPVHYTDIIKWKAFPSHYTETSMLYWFSVNFRLYSELWGRLT